MKKSHVLAASLILGLAAIFGVAAATKTAGFGAAAAQTQTGKVSDATIAARQHKLDRAEIALRRARADQPPALPNAPKVSAAAAPRAQRLVYTRPAPVVVVRSSASHEEQGDEHEQEREGGDD